MNIQGIEQLFSMISSAEKFVVFTGAGVSTLSGIPDFRGPQGVHKNRFKSWTVEELHHIKVFMAHPDAFYEFAREAWFNLDQLQHNVVHRVLAKLEENALLDAVYTQNIDMLHHQAGSKNVYEIHGTMASLSCLNCSSKYNFADMKKIVAEGKVPYCEKCNGLIKPDVIFFGEGLNMKLLEKARNDFSQADLVLVLGSSLTVEPAASFPLMTVRNKGKMVIVNSQKTPYDDLAIMRFNDLKSVFNEIEKKLDNK